MRLITFKIIWIQSMMKHCWMKTLKQFKNYWICCVISMTYNDYLNDRDKFGKLIHDLRIKNKMTDVDIYFQVGITASTYRNAESNMTTLRRTTFDKINKWMKGVTDC